MKVWCALLTIVCLTLCSVAHAEPSMVVEQRRRAVTSIAKDTLLGGLAGGALGGAVIGYRVGIQNQQNYGWAPVLATGVGLGLAGGLLLGLVSNVGTPGPTAVNGPVRDGMSLRELRPCDRSRQTTLSMLGGKF